MVLLRRQREDRSGGRATDARQGRQHLEVGGHGTVMLVAHPLRRPMEIPRAGVVTKARPAVQHFISRGSGQ